MTNLPTLGAIQRTNAVLGAVATSAMFYWRSPAAAASCLLAVVVVIANLYLLAWLGQAVLRSAARGGGSSWGVIALPLKLLFIAGLIYLVFHKTGIDALGFGVGVGTQFAAVLLETALCALGVNPARGLKQANL
jgi:hypothetical protein